jgi:hypothetical protein
MITNLSRDMEIKEFEDRMVGLFGNVYLSFLPKQIVWRSAKWEVCPVEKVGIICDNGEAINGVMLEGNFLDAWNEYEEPYHYEAATSFSEYQDLPIEFFNHELMQLFDGTEEEIIAICQKYGALISPLSRDAHMKFAEYVMTGLRGFLEPDMEIQQAYLTRRLESFNKVARFALSQIDSEEYSRSPTFSDTVVYGYRKTYELIRGLIDKGFDFRGIIVSFEEIRAVAVSLIEIKKFISSVSLGLPISTFFFMNEPKQPFGVVYFLHRCMRDAAPELMYELHDKSGSGITDREWLEYKPRIGSLTEAVAVQLYNAAISETGWKHCEHCGQTFQIKRGEGTKGRIRSADARFCCTNCQRAALQKRHRDKKRKEAQEQQSKPSNTPTV